MMALVGAHVSISGGLEKAPERGVAMGCEAIQIFTRNQMRWHANPLTPKEIEAYRKEWQLVGKSFPVMVHDAYLINLGSPEPEKLAMSRKAFLEEMERCEQLGVSYLVFHPGSHLAQVSEAQCLQTIIDSLNQLTAARPDDHVTILIENTAGQGSNVGYRFEHLATIIEGVEQPERLGVCMDTCHALAAGYDLRTEAGYHQVMTEFDKVVGLKWLKAFHLNDSKKPLGSKVDRHENIGEGCVGLEAFRMLVNDPRFSKTPMVLETPGGDDAYVRNLQRLKNMVTTHNSKSLLVKPK